MSSVNLHTREVAIKVVYYGPGVGGKTCSLQFIHRALKPDTRGQLVSLATGEDRTLYFDFLPLKLPKVGGFSVRVQLYTVPGQVHYNSTRKLVLTGADGIVFVADSQQDRLVANSESMADLADNLSEQGLRLATMPLVLQLNKRDAPRIASVAELNTLLNPRHVPAFETVATKGTGVFEALKSIITLVLNDLRAKGSLGDKQPRAASVPPAVQATSDGVPRNVATDAASASRRIVVKPPAPASETMSMTYASLSEAVVAVSALAPAARVGTPSGQYPTPTFAAARSLSDLIGPSPMRDVLVAIEADIDGGHWAVAIRRAGEAFTELAGRLAGAMGGEPAEARSLAALLTGIPPNRYLRFREAEGRAQSQAGGVTSTDALYALFFLADLCLRADELRARG